RNSATWGWSFDRRQRAGSRQRLASAWRPTSDHRMPLVTLVPFTGFRVRESEMLALGMSLPGLRQRAAAVGQLPALGLITLAGMTPPPWTCSYHEAAGADEALAEKLARQRPDLVALSALTASVEEAYRFAARL